MSHMPSLADQTIAALAAVAAMDGEITNDSPERHQVRSLKRAAEQILSDAMRHANDLAYLAKDIQRTMREVTEPQP